MPPGLIVYTIIRNGLKGSFIANYMVVKPRLPLKFRMNGSRLNGKGSLV